MKTHLHTFSAPSPSTFTRNSQLTHIIGFMLSAIRRPENLLGSVINAALFSKRAKSEALTPDDHEHDDEEGCIANISPRERMKRLIGGVIPFVIAIAILTWLISTNADRLWRLPLFLLFVAAASGFFQWRDKT